MRGTAFRYIFIVPLIFMTLGVSYVLAQGPPDHLGEICITCHQKYSDNTAIAQFSPCAKKVCHKSNPTERWGGRGPHDRYPLHLKKEICGNCHRIIDGRYDIHSIHLKFGELGINRAPIECRTCHWLPEGYNSSLAYVPAYDNLYIAGSTLTNTSIRIPPWRNDCGYCHPSVVGARRLHDVHEPVIEIVCKECHGSIIESRLELIAKITGKPLQPEIETKREILVVKELSLLFDEIAWQILDFYNYLRI